MNMNKNHTSFRNSGPYTSPGTPDYSDNSVGGIQKGWYSERVPLPANRSRRHISASALMPFNSGRALPSKWDDAERWITSPVASYGVCQPLVAPPHRRPKSKSGPLGNPCFPNYSPAVSVSVSVCENGNFNARSPFSTGVIVADGVSVHYGGGIGVQSNNVRGRENGIARLVSAPVWSDLLSESSLQDEKQFDYSKDAQNTVSFVVSRRDVATQMSPVRSTNSSPEGRSSHSTYPLPVPPQPVELPSSYHSSPKLEVRDVEVDKGINLPRQSKRMTKKGSPNDEGFASSPWNVAEPGKNTPRLQREEAKINAWENLQKAKAEAAIQKLEMKLEKKRSASMDKILNKLRVAQMKAQEARRVISETPQRDTTRNSHKVVWFRGCRKLQKAIRVQPVLHISGDLLQGLDDQV